VNKKIDYSFIKAGDIVLTGGRSLFSYLIRLVTAGFKKRHDKTTVTHVGIVVDLAGQKYIMEMLKDGMALSPFSRYLGESHRRWIIGVTTHPKLSVANRMTINSELMTWYRRGSEKNKYDWRAIIGFSPVAIMRIKHSPDKWICSELASYFWRTFAGVKLPKNAELVSPAMFDPNHEGEVIDGITAVKCFV